MGNARCVRTTLSSQALGALVLSSISRSPAFINWSSIMLPFLSLHALAAQRGDGLRPELLALFKRHARSEAGLPALVEPPQKKPPYPARATASRDPVKKRPTNAPTPPHPPPPPPRDQQTAPP